MKKAILITTLLAALPLRAEVTFTKDVAPIIFNHCAGCHRPGEAAPFALLNYNDVRKRARLIVRVTEDRVMPPWHAEKGSFVFHGDRQVLKDLTRLFQAGLGESGMDRIPPELSYLL